MSTSTPLFSYRISQKSVALGKPCGVCAAPFRVDDHICLAVGAARPAAAVGVHTACLPASPEPVPSQ
jgi:hypothetical protein